MKKGSKLYSVSTLTCPRCQEVKMFKTGTWSFSKPFEMHDRCPHCDLNFMPEPGYYFGAMFVSYIFWGWMSLFIVGGLILLFDWAINPAFLVLLTISAILFIWIFRVSRVVWINVHVKYSAEYKSD